MKAFLCVLVSLVAPLAAVTTDEGLLQKLLGTILGAASEKKRGDRVPMKVIGASFGRTGTNSLMMALDQLGYKTYHMERAFELKHHAQWAKAWPTDGPGTNQTGLGEMLDTIAEEGFDAGVDFPISLAYREIMERHPESLVILSVRSSAEVWAKSYTETIGQMGHLSARPPLTFIFPGFDILHHWMMSTSGLPGPGEEVSLERSAAAYTAWNEKVKAHVPKDRLLVHAVTDGWPPLCAFLKVPPSKCPSNNGEAYPRAANDSAAMKRMVKIFTVVTDWWNVILASALGFVAIILGAVYRCILRCCCPKQAEKLKRT